ncbi:MAG: hypothetical protein QF577_03935 [Phycisphaerae bacterium]|nr:hypothetical protein [Phycisphaerae bacterium]
MSALEETLLFQIKAEGLPIPEREKRFHETRKWRFDFYWPEIRVACEVEGGTYRTSRHTTGVGFHNDCEKYNNAALLGILVLRVDSKHIKDGSAIDWLRKALCSDQDMTLLVGQ